LDIFCILLSRLLAGRQPAARLQDSYNLNGCRYRAKAGKTTGGDEHNSTAPRHAGGCFYVH